MYGMGRLQESHSVDGLEILADLRMITSDKEAYKNLLRLLCDIDEELLLKLISVLQSFEDVRVLYSDKCPSLHLVIATKVYLQMHLSSFGRDLPIIGQMKSHLMTQLLCYFTVTDIHAAATLLDSRPRNTPML